MLVMASDLSSLNELVEATKAGVDVVITDYPLRLALAGKALAIGGDTCSVSFVDLKEGSLSDKQVVDADCSCCACKNGVSRGYLRHLTNIGEMLATTWLHAHNLRAVDLFMTHIRKSIEAGDVTLADLQAALPQEPELEPRGYKRQSN